MTDTLTQTKKFKDQTVEERYIGLVNRLAQKMDELRIWEDDCNDFARQSQAKGNHGMAAGLFGRAKTINKVRKQLEPYIDRHLEAIAADAVNQASVDLAAAS